MLERYGFYILRDDIAILHYIRRLILDFIRQNSKELIVRFKVIALVGSFVFVATRRNHASFITTTGRGLLL